MKYILKEKIPFTKYEIGHVFETDFRNDIEYVTECDEAFFYNSIQLHETLLMVKAGILEEYDDGKIRCVEDKQEIEKIQKKIGNRTFY